MFDRYDTAVLYNAGHTEAAYCSADKGGSLLLQYTAWCDLKEISDTEFNKQRSAFFDATIAGEGDALQKILSKDNDGDRRAQIEFLYAAVDFMVEFQKLAESSAPDQKRKEELIEELKQPGVLSSLIGVSIESAVSLRIHISEADKTRIEMFWFADAGVFISVGVGVNVRKEAAFDALAVFKALGDESRLGIVRALARENMTPSQLAEKVGVTMPTINHHLKQLTGCGLVGMVITGKIGRGMQYRLHREVALAMLEEVKNEIS
jgi:ArsR family transcriptional regulator